MNSDFHLLQFMVNWSKMKGKLIILKYFRINRYKLFKEFKKRIMVATDVFGRGIDIERVNIVINYDMADSADTYLHRVGRAGRFGTKGLTISLVSSDDDKKVLEEIQNRFTVKMKEYPLDSHVESSSYSKLKLFNII